MIVGIDHLQISIPAGRVEEALAFYVGILGFTRVPKPAEMSPTGAWLVSSKNQAGVNLHLGEIEKFATDGNAHPALLVTDLSLLLLQLEAAHFRVRRESTPHGFSRASTWDPFGNRIEFMQPMT